jgi:hypothetical protein
MPWTASFFGRSYSGSAVILAEISSLLGNDHVDVASLIVDRRYARRGGITVRVKLAAANACVRGSALGGIQIRGVQPRACGLASHIAT